MKAFLMYRDRDFDLEIGLPLHGSALIQDLELETLFNAMARGDEFLFRAAKTSILSSVQDLGTIRYRQDILRDCLRNPETVRELYDIAVTTIESKRKHYWGFSSRIPSSILRSSVEELRMFSAMLRKLRGVADRTAVTFESQGFTCLFGMLKEELQDEYLAELQDHLERLRFRGGTLISAQLGKGNKGDKYILRKPRHLVRNWVDRIFAPKPPAAFTFHLHPRDESGAIALSELRGRGINLVANAVAQSADHILGFFTMLQVELAFYVGCLNLHEQIAQRGGATCFPVPADIGERRYSFEGLYDVCLALSLRTHAVGNAVDANGKDIVLITGANQGGKSTFLRSVGLSQLMMQCGMFVSADSFRASVCDHVFTHYKREEDASMVSGKLDEELRRMSDIVDYLTPDSIVLFNESFAATNEREGSEIGRQIIRALSEKHVRIFFVTHFYDLAYGLWEQGMENAIFLRAERQVDGRRTFRLAVGEPLKTSYGADLYEKIFNEGGAVY